MSDPDSKSRDQRKPAGRGEPDEPLPGQHRDGSEAEVRERDRGAHAEQVGDGLYREDEDPPGV